MDEAQHCNILKSAAKIAQTSPYFHELCQQFVLPKSLRAWHWINIRQQGPGVQLGCLFGEKILKVDTVATTTVPAV